ncbi:hypothetical protein BsWGS_24028 [Bradybaena similaris]
MSLHSAPITSTPEPMGKPRRSARLSAARLEDASTSRAPSSTKYAEHPPREPFQPQTQNISKERKLNKTQSQPGHTRVRHSKNRANITSIMRPVDCVSVSAAKTTRSPMLAKRDYRKNTGRDADDTRQQRRNEGLRNLDLKTARRRVFQGRKRKDKASSSKPETKNSANSVNINHTARSPASQVSTSTDKKARPAVYDPPVHRVQACQEAIRMVLAMGNKELMQESMNWNLNWSCSLMTHDTNVTPPEWLYFM